VWPALALPLGLQKETEHEKKPVNDCAQLHNIGKTFCVAGKGNPVERGSAVDKRVMHHSLSLSIALKHNIALKLLYKD
jgi:hypothetical protein